jgi:hypothetical protein
MYIGTQGLTFDVMFVKANLSVSMLEKESILQNHF